MTGAAARPAGILPVIILSQFAGTSLWFAGNAVIDELQRKWNLGTDAIEYRTGASAASRRKAARDTCRGSAAGARNRPAGRAGCGVDVASDRESNSS